MEKDKLLKMHLQYFASKDPEETVEPEVENTEPEKEPEATEPTAEPKPTEEDPKPEEPKPTEEPEAEKKPEGKSSEEQSEELAELKRKLQEAEDIKSQYETAKAELHKYETSLATIAEQKIEALPEEYRELVPEGDTQSKLDWLAKAEKSGLLNKKEEVSIGKSTKANHKESQEADFKDMTANQKLLTGIKEFYSRNR